jgi:hypothetical protein
MAILIAPFIALFIVVLSACVIGLALFVVAAIFGFRDEKKIGHEGPRPLPRRRQRPSSR